jgi:uncharacterized protein (TIGR00299 family) protein
VHQKSILTPFFCLDADRVKPPGFEDQDMRIAYFDCLCGAAGDMIIGALLDAGASFERLRTVVDSLDLAGCKISASRVTKQQFAATQFEVHVASSQQPHRHLKDILAIINQGSLPPSLAERASAIFHRLGAAEAKVHGCNIQDVHFHEIGAVDTIVDIVGALAALDDLGVTSVVTSPIPMGTGTVDTEHGRLPVPAPATAELLTGIPIGSCDEPGELTTPTGAAVLTAVTDAYGPTPSMTLEAVGYGAGRRDGIHRPNLLRVLLGSPLAGGTAEEVILLEAGIDDATGEAIGHCLERALDAGALDAYCVPIYMKKSRPGVLVTVLSTPPDADRLEEILFAETTTFGVRRHSARRSTLQREHQPVDTPFGQVRVKVGRRGSQVLTVSPEYEDCRSLARQRNCTLAEVMNAAWRAWEQKQVASERQPD